MRCHKAQELISLSLDDAIGEYDRSRLVRHLESCSDCASFQSVLQRGSDVLRSAPLVAPSENFEWKVQLGIQRALRDGARAELPSSRPKNLWLSAGLSAAASALLVVGLGWAVLSSGFLGGPSQGQQPTSTNLRSGAQIAGNSSTPNFDSAIPGPAYQQGRMDRGNVTPVSGTRGTVIPGVGEMANPSFTMVSIDDYLLMQRENQILRMQLRQQAQHIHNLQMRLTEGHIPVVGDSGAAEEPR